MKGSKDSGVGDSLETDPQAVATASAVQLELVADEKERKEPYLVREGRKHRPTSGDRPKEQAPKANKPRPQDALIKESARDRRRHSREETSAHTSVSRGDEQARAMFSPSSEVRNHGVRHEDVVGRDHKEDRHRQEKHQSRAHRPLPPPPDALHGLEQPQKRKTSDDKRKIDNRLREKEGKEPELSAGVPNTAARKKRRQRMQEEDIRRSKMSGTPVVTPRYKNSPDSFDSVDGPTPFQSQASNSDDDTVGSDADEAPPQSPVQKEVKQHRQSTDMGYLIETLQQTLSLGQRPGSERSSPEDSVDSSPPDDKEPDSPNSSGRLQDRISRLRRECIRGIGEEKLLEAYRIIDAIDEDNVEVALVKLMGRENFEIYGGLIWQLKFCEEFRV